MRGSIAPAHREVSVLHPKLVSRDIRICEPAPPEHASCRGVRLFLGHIEMIVSGVRCVRYVFKANEINGIDEVNGAYGA